MELKEDNLENDSESSPKKLFCVVVVGNLDKGTATPMTTFKVLHCWYACLFTHRWSHKENCSSHIYLFYLCFIILICSLTFL